MHAHVSDWWETVYFIVHRMYINSLHITAFQTFNLKSTFNIIQYYINKVEVSLDAYKRGS